MLIVPRRGQDALLGKVGFGATGPGFYSSAPAGITSSPSRQVGVWGWMEVPPVTSPLSPLAGDRGSGQCADWWPVRRQDWSPGLLPASHCWPDP